MKNLLKFTTLFVMFFLLSCSSNSDDDDLIENPPAAITYSNSISAIMSGNCTGCHGSTPSNGAPMSLTSFANVKSAVETRGLIGLIENGTMPPNGNLSAAEIQNIKTWQTNNFPE